MSADDTPAPPGADPGAVSLQRRYAPHNACFGCGQANPKGLRIESFVTPDGLVARFTPEPHHEAFPGVLNGGIIGALLDCHANWTAAHAMMQARGEATPPCTVTAEFHVKLRAPTPSNAVVTLTARPFQLGAGKGGDKTSSGGASESGASESGAAPDGASDRASIDRCTVDAELSSGGKVTATMRGTFVAVKEGHPAYHRW